MSLSAREIEQVVAALQPLAGGFVQKIALPEPRSAYFELRQPGASSLLLVCAESGRTRIHLARSRPPSPETPFAFQGLLRAHLTGTALAHIEASPGERSVLLRFRGPEGMWTLVAELTGRHGNLFLLDDSGRVRGSAVPNLSSLRDNAPGQAYVPLRPRPGPPPGENTSRFEGLQGAALSAAIEEAYARRDRAELSAARRRALLQPLRARQQRVLRTLEKVREDLARALKADEHLRRGELLKSALGRLQRGMREAQVVEYTEEGPREVVLALDPARTPRENVEREFHLYRRLSQGQARARARLSQLEGELEELERKARAIETLSDAELAEQAGPALAPSIPRARRAAAAERAKPYREYLSRGQRIRVGRGARENDALTFRHARGNDVWLHARGVTGAHVVIPLDRGESPREETLLDAALLAAHHSQARGQSLVEVAWTRVKHVHKVKGVPGAVTYSQDKTIAVRPDPERLARLLEQAAMPPPQVS